MLFIYLFLIICYTFCREEKKRWKSQKNTKVVIALLIIIIAILSALCILFATGTISLKSNDAEVNNPEQNANKNNDLNKTPIILKQKILQ